MRLFRLIFFWTWCLLFLLFAYWQLNDPDTWLWMSIYAAAAFLSGLSARRIFPLPVILALALAGLIGFASLYPSSVSDWIRQEWQQQDLSMKTQEMEEARESFGLLIVSTVMLVAAYFGWRDKNSAKNTRIEFGKLAQV